MQFKNVTIGSVTVSYKTWHGLTDRSYTSWHVLKHRPAAMICGGFPTEAEAREYCESKGYTIKKVNPHYSVEHKDN